MASSIVTWDSQMPALGRAVVAIGVFDGVHIGHAALLRDTVADARARGVASVAATFDRDPDQIVAPATAAPQLLTLEAKLAAIGRTGIDTILVIPFTSQLASLDPDAFLERVLFRALIPVAIHVGSDFRFGRMALGDLSTLQRAGAIQGFDVVGHELVTLDGEAVTSTRIRGLVASGHIAEAIALLGGKPCVTGSVHRGRGEGRTLGFPTANVVPVPFAALPADGVYAGRAIIADGSEWASAISVGTPPSFPEARDYLEAHLIGFDGDLYDQAITIEFWERLRDQQRYDSLDALTAAIRTDAGRALEIAGFSDDELESQPAEPPAQPADRDADASADPTGEADPDIDDPVALEAAERAAQAYREPEPDRAHTPEEGWVDVISDTPFQKQRFKAIDAALLAHDIDHIWEPYAPDEAPLLRMSFWDTERFSVSVPESFAEDASAIIEAVDDENAAHWDS